MDADDYEIGLLAGRRDIGGDELLVSRRGTGAALRGKELQRLGEGVAEQGDPRAPHRHDHRPAGFGKTAPGSDPGDPLPVKVVEGIGKRFGAEIHDVVVGQGNGVDAGFFQGRSNGRCTPEAESFVSELGATGCKRSFQIGDGDISVGQFGSNAGKGEIIPLLPDGLLPRAGQHDVTNGIDHYRCGMGNEGIDEEQCCDQR